MPANVSVIVLTWNSEKYIEECISSIHKDARATNIEIELIVVDNGS
ncbi:MAG: glycosyltransferase family 2 protein, partial [Candidatus Hodarchaeales archaeon]